MKQFLLKSLLFIAAAMPSLIAVPAMANDAPAKRSSGWVSPLGNTTSNQKNWGITGFGVFRETPKSVAYVQGRYQETTRKPVKENNLNLGVGYRRLLGATIIGANVFFTDMSTFRTESNIWAYYQTSVGLEIKRKSLEIASNVYMPRNPGTLKNGWDVTVKKNLFMRPNIALGGGSYRLNSFVEDRRKVVTGNKVFVELKPNAVLTIRVQQNRPKQDKKTTSVSIGVKFGLNKSWRQQWKQFRNRKDAVWRTRYDAATRW